MFAPQPGAGGFRRESWASGQGGARAPGKGGRGAGGRGGRNGAPFEALVPRGEAMRSSSLVRGPAAGLNRNEALLLLAAGNHPWLLDSHCEDLADLPFASREAAEMRRILIEVHMEGEGEDEGRIAARLAAAKLEGLPARIAALAVARHDWPAFAGAARADVELWWHQRTALQRRAHALSRELKEAERALADEPTELNWARFLDVQKRLAALDGTEALVEGFGAASGRSSRSM